jgi:hypothetical protein
MDSYGNSGFKGVGKVRADVSSLNSKNVRTQRLSVTGTSQLNDVTIANDLEVADGIVVTGGGIVVDAGGLTVTGNSLLNNNLTVNGNTRLGNANTDTVGFYTTNGTAQQTTSVASATVVNGAAGDAITATTFDGYTVAQVVRAVRNVGLIA